jgi:hypothetical protein
VILVCVMTGLIVTGSLPGEALSRERAIGLARDAIAATGLAPPFELRRAEPATWDDETLGCGPSRPTAEPPRPVQGHRVFLTSAGLIYRVHVGAGKALVCGPPLNVLPEEGDEDLMSANTISIDTLGPVLQTLVGKAREDLARRRGLDLEDIDVLEAEPVVWPDSALGCPEPGMMYQQVVQEGTRIVLRAEGRRWRYHAGPRRDPFLCERGGGHFERQAPQER